MAFERVDEPEEVVQRSVTVIVAVMCGDSWSQSSSPNGAPALAISPKQKEKRVITLPYCNALYMAMWHRESCLFGGLGNFKPSFCIFPKKKMLQPH